MTQSRPRLTLGRCLALTALIAADLAFLRAFQSEGPLAEGLLGFGLALSVAAVGMMTTSGRLRQSFAGFLASGVVAAVLALGTFSAAPTLTEQGLDAYRAAVKRRLPPRFSVPIPVILTSGPTPTLVFRPSRSSILLHEALFSLPMIALAATGGALALAFPRGRRVGPSSAGTAPGPDPQPATATEAP